MTAHLSRPSAITMTPSRYVADILGIANQPFPKGRIGSSPTCWLCGGATHGQGWRHADAIGGTFTQYSCAVAPDSDAVCQPCVATITASVFQGVVARRGMDIKIWSQCGWHSYSHLVTSGGGYECPKPGRIREILIDPPTPPFVVGLNPSGQKHSLFRTRVAMSRDLFPVHFDERTFVVDRRRFADLLADFERMTALGFSKEQVKTGRYHPESIRRAGLAAWRGGEIRVREWRESSPDWMALAAWVGRGPKWFADNGLAIGPTPNSLEQLRAKPPAAPAQGGLF